MSVLLVQGMNDFEGMDDFEGQRWFPDTENDEGTRRQAGLKGHSTALLCLRLTLEPDPRGFRRALSSNQS